VAFGDSVAPNGARIRYTILERKKVGEVSALPVSSFATLALVAYPNPAQEGTWIATSENGPLSVRLYNNLGQVVYEAQAEGNGFLYIPRNGLPAGLYRLRVQSTTGTGLVSILFE
jgi:hypothetical protein